MVCVIQFEARTRLLRHPREQFDGDPTSMLLEYDPFA